VANCRYHKLARKKAVQQQYRGLSCEQIAF